MVSVGFVLSQEQFDQPRLIKLGMRAEQAGFDMVWTSDHFHPWMHNQGHAGFAWVTLAALGQRLERIPMGTGVTCPTYRYHPAIVAQAFASLGELYPGRVFLGAGTGEAVNEQAATGEWGDYSERADRFEEAIQLIRQLWSGDTVDFNGQYYHTHGAKLYSLPPQRVPIFIAASGDNSMRIAGKYGDGLITDPKSLSEQDERKAFEEGARSAGKNAESMPILAESFVFVGEKSETQKAAELWRFIPEAWTKYVDNPDPRDIHRDAQSSVPLDKVTEEWVIGTDAQTHIENIEKLVSQGVTHVFIHTGQEDQERAIDFYGRAVLPKIRHEIMQMSDLITHPA